MRDELSGSAIKLQALEALEAQDRDRLLKTIIVILPDEPLLPQRLNDLDRVEQKLAGLLNRFSPDHPEVKETLALQTVIQTQVEARLGSLLDGLRANQSLLQARHDALSNQAIAAREAAAAEVDRLRRYAVLKRRADASRTSFYNFPINPVRIPATPLAPDPR